MSLLRQPPVPGTRSAALERIRSVVASLAPSERRVGEAILADPGATIALSIGEFAESCGVAQPTLSRFAKSAGFAGWPALRLSIAHDFATDRSNGGSDHAEENPYSGVRRRIRSDGAVSAIAELIRASEAVEIWTSPELASAGNLLAARLRSRAVSAAASSVPAHWEMRAEGLPSSTTVLVLTGSMSDVPAAAIQRARTTGAQVTIATSRAVRSWGEPSDVVLSLPQLDPPEALGLMVCDAIEDAVASISNVVGPDGPASPWLRWPHQRTVFLPGVSDDPIPAVLMSPSERAARADGEPGGSSVPLILYFTGMNGSALVATSPAVPENHIDSAMVSALLNSGCQVLVTENPAHGMRKRVWESPGELLIASLSGQGPDLLELAAAEAGALIDGALALPEVDAADPIAIVGQSWGGLQAMLKMSRDQRIRCGVAIVPVARPGVLEPFTELSGTPRETRADLRGPLGDALAPRPLLLITGVDDDIAPPTAVTELEEYLRPRYTSANASDALRHDSLEGLAHEFDKRQVELMLDWLDTHLS